MEQQPCRALLIGNSTFPSDPHNLPELKGPVNDIALLRDALTDRAVGLFEARNVRLLSERTKPEITTAMEDLFQSARREDTLLLYYSGHGLQDSHDHLFLCARDTRADRLVSTAISDGEINAMMRESSAQTFVIILDCCHSGAFKGAGVPGNLRGTGRFLITSSRRRELSADAPDESGPSAFTSHLVEALRLGTLDYNGDGYVTLNDLYDYVLEALRGDTGQIPQRHFDNAVGDVALARAAVRPIVPHMKAPAAPPERPALDLSDTTIEGRDVRPGVVHAVAVERPHPDVQRRVSSRRPLRAGIALAILAALATAGVLAWQWLSDLSHAVGVPEPVARFVVGAHNYPERSESVCSDGVRAGIVVEVILDYQDREVPIVTSSGITAKGSTIFPGTPLLLEVSNGRSCPP